MNISWKLGRVAGIDLYLHPTFLLILAVAALWNGVDGAIFLSAVFGCVVLHELGHALTARLFGVRTRDITLYPIGGVARLERMPKAPGAELLITLAGPLVNVAIAALLLLFHAGSGDFRGPYSAESPLMEFTWSLMWVNAILAVFNMIPAFPMDGGRVLRALLTPALGRFRATQIAASLGQILAIVLPIVAWRFLGFNPFHLILGLFIYYSATTELAQVRAEGQEDADDRDGHEGIWTAPPGYRWVDRGNGFWQLAPIHVGSEPRNFRSWR